MWNGGTPRSTVACAPLSRSFKPARAPVTSRPVGDSLYLVVPAFNESPRLGETLHTLCSAQRNVVVVDDGSIDTAAIALRHPVWLLRDPINCGQGAALQTGVDFALARGAEVIVTFDADGQHDATEIDRLVRPVREKRADVVLGSRFLGSASGIPPTRWAILKLGILWTRFFSRLRVTDTHNGLRALSRDAARRIRLTHPRMAHASELLDQIRAQGLRHVEVPVTVGYSQATLAKGQRSWGALRIAGELLLGRLIR
jgi:glycosyltransferase involved in cell wall biosynthesis